jgi:GR25 family glycosyltransferase involved in LPS biosynthesis
MKKPVLFLIFNRPEYTYQVFDSIKLYKPNKLYIAADGPRLNNIDDILLCEESRKILNLIDWECEVKYLFREINLGCKLAVVSAINWFFNNEEDGIILEDDVVPNQDFYTFCEFTLNKYKNNEKILMVTGCNQISDINIKSSYFYSQIFTIWGWATWKRAWQLYDIDMKKWDDNQIKLNIKYMTHKKYIWMNLKYTFDSLKKYSINTWDIQWHFTCLINSGLCVTPSINLITNIGVIGTHSNSISESHFLKADLFEEQNNYVIPETIIVNSLYDQNLFEIKAKKMNQRYFMINFLKQIKLFELFKFMKYILKK